MLQLQQQLTPGLLDFDSRNSPLLSSRIHPERFQTFLFFSYFFLSKFELAFTETGLDQTHIFQNPNLNLSKVQVQVHISKNWIGKGLNLDELCP